MSTKRRVSVKEWIHSFIMDSDSSLSDSDVKLKEAVDSTLLDDSMFQDNQKKAKKKEKGEKIIL